jgi:hypothetical protein
MCFPLREITWSLPHIASYTAAGRLISWLLTLVKDLLLLLETIWRKEHSVSRELLGKLVAGAFRFFFCDFDRLVLHFMVLLFSHSKHICEMMWKCKEHETGNFGIIIQWRSFFSLWWSSGCEIRSCIVDWRLVRKAIGDRSPRLEKRWKLIMFEMHPKLWWVVMDQINH